MMNGFKKKGGTTGKIGRDAGTGKVKSEKDAQKDAQKDKKGSIVETIKTPPKKPKK